MERFEQLLSWLAGLDYLKNIDYSTPVPASSDASFRRYFRISFAAEVGEQSLIIMDAPPEKENSLPFVQIATELHELGLNVPKVLAKDLAQGFLLLSDLGTKTYLSVLNENNAEQLYLDALQPLISLQTKANPAHLPAYDDKLLAFEMSLFKDWLAEKHCDLSMNNLDNQIWLEAQNVLIKSALAQPKVYVHRDYHSRNLMFSDGSFGKNPGILDFQDAVAGPLTYDAVSMLRDCYVVWPAEQVLEWQRQYFLLLVEAGKLSKDEWQGFVEAFDLMGIQRHLKAAGIFARLYHRDGKDGYLKDIPPTLDYILQVGANYSSMKDLVKFTEKLVEKL